MCSPTRRSGIVFTSSSSPPRSLGISRLHAPSVGKRPGTMAQVSGGRDSGLVRTFQQRPMTSPHRMRMLRVHHASASTEESHDGHAHDKGWEGMMKIVARSADVDGTKVHYLTAGRGEPVILLHGYTQTSKMWRPIIPALAERFSVIAPDLPGIGDSAVPSGEIDMVNAATRIRGLAQTLGLDNARVVGHDIGLMVAYAYAAR